MNRVIVVGAGPAGAATAYLLAQQGIRVTLIERETAFDRVFRGEGLMPSGVEALHQMGLKDCLDHIPSRALDAWVFYIDQQQRMRVTETQDPRGRFTTQIVSQSALLASIVKQASRFSTFEFCPGWRVKELLKNETGVCGVRATQGKDTREFLGDWVIAADGRYSSLRKLAGLSLKMSPTQFDVVWFKLPAPSEWLRETAFTVCLRQDRQFAFYPSWDERLQLGWIIEKGKEKQAGDRDWISAFIPALPPDLAKHFRQHRQQLEGPIFLDVVVGCCPQWHSPGLLLIGDAAHPMAPNRAQGINMAFRDAIALANHLVPLLTPDKSASAEAINQALIAVQQERMSEIQTVQQLQLEEWEKIELFTRNSFTYLPFKTLATILGNLWLTQQAWLWQQRGLRHGTTLVRLTV